MRSSLATTPFGSAVHLQPQSAVAPLDVTVFDNLAEAEACWRRLAERSPHSPYQAFDWAAAWTETVGRANGIAPAIVRLRDQSGRDRALLPLGIARRFGLRVARFLGGVDSNGNLGLFDPAVAWSTAMLCDMLVQAAATARIDLFDLDRQHAAWLGQPNPLRLFGSQQSPSSNHAVDLADDPDRHFEHTLSKHARKHLRGKRARLERLGTVQHLQVRSRAEAQAVLDCHLAQKAARFADLGIPPRADADAARQFLDRATDPESFGGASVELHALVCGSDVVAILGGTGSGSRFSGMILSHDTAAPYAACSPGDLLVQDVIADQCRRGVRSFDLGIGEARYKTTFCPTIEPLFDLHLGMTVRGRIAAWVLTAGAVAKRRIKQSPRLWPAVLKARRVLRGTA